VSDFQPELWNQVPKMPYECPQLSCFQNHNRAECWDEEVDQPLCDVLPLFSLAKLSADYWNYSFCQRSINFFFCRIYLLL